MDIATLDKIQWVARKMIPKLKRLPCEITLKTVWVNNTENKNNKKGIVKLLIKYYCRRVVRKYTGYVLLCAYTR